MPHVDLFVRRDIVSRLVLAAFNGDSDDCTPGQLPYSAARVVAEVWLRHTDEELEVGLDGECIPYPLRISSSMPSDLRVNVTCWWKPERAEHFAAIERDLKEAFARWAPDLKISVSLIVDGEDFLSGDLLEDIWVSKEDVRTLAATLGLGGVGSRAFIGIQRSLYFQNAQVRTRKGSDGKRLNARDLVQLISNLSNEDLLGITNLGDGSVECLRALVGALMDGSFVPGT